jgi:hypothetical protein
VRDSDETHEKHEMKTEQQSFGEKTAQGLDKVARYKKKNQ